MTGFRINRRAALGGVMGTAAAVVAAPRVRAGSRPVNFVFVPGTWHGGWVWQRLRQPLYELGHAVYTPTPTGVGERVHLSSPDIGLETHIQDIVNVIEFEGLDDVILIGHSFAGMTITGVADRLRERIRRLVFFDALVPTEERPAAVMPDSETGEYPQWWQVFSPSSDAMAGPALTDPERDLIEFPYHRNSMLTHPRETVAMLVGLV